MASWESIKKALQQGGFILNNLFPVIAASYVSREWEEEPLWILAVAPPGSGKSVTMSLFSELTEAELVSAVTPASLISGYGGLAADPSLFATLDKKVLLAKDFGTILSMASDTAAAVFGYLREAYDGHVKKVFGNSITREYWLKFNFVAATTEAYERVSIFRVQLGERFIRFNAIPAVLPVPPPIIDERLKSNVAAWLTEMEREKPPTLSVSEQNWLHSLGTATSKLRTEVIHDSYTKEVLEIPGFEGSARLEKQLTKLYRGLRIVFGQKAAAKKVTTHCAKSSIAPRKLLVLREINKKPFKYSVNDLAERTRLGSNVIRWLLNDFYVLHLVEHNVGEHNTYNWAISDEFDEELSILL